MHLGGALYMSEQQPPPPPPPDTTLSAPARITGAEVWLLWRRRAEPSHEALSGTPRRGDAEEAHACFGGHFGGFLGVNALLN